MSLFRGRVLKLRRCDSRSELMRFDIVPDIVFLQVGENDVVAATNSNKLAEDIISLAQYLWDGVGSLISQYWPVASPHAVCVMQRL